MHPRTDLAIELNELRTGSGDQSLKLEGVAIREYLREGFNVTFMEVQNEDGEREIGKKKGKYVTISLTGLINRENGAFSRVASALCSEIISLCPEIKKRTILVAGLGNRAITPDAIGPSAVENVMATRHLVEKLPEQFSSFNRVSAISPGVLGITGIETGEIIKGIVEKTSPGLIITVDALASRRLSRLCTTVQLCDTGIEPGSGVGNRRSAINCETMGAPVIAIGVPTVVDAATLAYDILEQNGVEGVDEEKLMIEGGNLMVTPKNIDRSISDISKVIGYGINLAAHENLSVEDIDMFLS